MICFCWFQSADLNFSNQKLFSLFWLSSKCTLILRQLPNISCCIWNIFYPSVVAILIKSFIKKELIKWNRNVWTIFGGGDMRIIWWLLIVQERSESIDCNSFTFLFYAQVTVPLVFWSEQDFLGERLSQLELFTDEIKKRLTGKYWRKKSVELCGCFNKAKKNRDLLFFSKTVVLIKMMKQTDDRRS